MALAQTESDTKFAEKVKTNVAKRGAGKDVKVKIKLKDGTKLKGYVSKVKDSGFVVVNEKTRTDTEIQYLQVKQLEQSEGNKSSTVNQILKGALIIGVFALFGWAYGDG